MPSADSFDHKSSSLYAQVYIWWKNHVPDIFPFDSIVLVGTIESVYCRNFLAIRGKNFDRFSWVKGVFSRRTSGKHEMWTEYCQYVYNWWSFEIIGENANYLSLIGLGAQTHKLIHSFLGKARLYTSYAKVTDMLHAFSLLSPPSLLFSPWSKVWGPSAPFPVCFNEGLRC